MTHQSSQDELDSILQSEDTLLPSSGFAESVMHAIQQKAAEPAPIPFPWKLALPGFAIMLAGLVLLFRLVYLGLNQKTPAFAGATGWLGSLPLGSLSLASLTWSAVQTAMLRTQALPALLAFIVALACAALCRRLASGPS